ncbi:MAG: hypothetical protein MK194_10445 [Roseibacillus sp.]|nr:hypothetical protein [Roseibacillus sp.]
MKIIQLSATLSLGFCITSAYAAEPNFEAQTVDPQIAIGYGLAIGDVDGDGDQDILLADKRDFWWYENPSWKKHLFHTFHKGEKRGQLRDNVCIAARDIDGDGKVEVAVGGNWNPGNTDSEEQSGSIHYLGSLGKVNPVRLPHDPTTHRMRWVDTGDKNYALVVLPLHGRGNRGGQGKGVNVTAYIPPADPSIGNWKTAIINNELHKTHNFDSMSSGSSDSVVIAGAEGARAVWHTKGTWHSSDLALPDMNNGAGEIRIGKANPFGVYGKQALSQKNTYACIEPLHGNTVAVYEVEGGKGGKTEWQRTVLDDSLAQGHALEYADVLGTGSLQVIAGWRNPNKEGKVGIKLYARAKEGEWKTHLLDDNKMACEDLKIADLNKDGKLDIIACGRSTRNVVIYWNK